MSDIYKLQYNGMTLAYPGWNGYVSYEAAPAYKTLTLCAAEGGTLTADTITGMPGDTVTLSPIYDTYWRFSGYAKAGDGSISDNTYTFGNDDEQIVSAYFKPNAFTASGGFEQGSDVICGVRTTANVPTRYILHTAHTGDIPTAWYATSNRWKPNNISAYKLTMNSKMSFYCNGLRSRPTNATATTLVGSTQNQTQTFTFNKGSTWYTQTYNVTVTSTTQNVNYGVSGKMSTVGDYYASKMYCYATGFNGTWSATGYAP